MARVRIASWQDLDNQLGEWNEAKQDLVRRMAESIQIKGAATIDRAADTYIYRLPFDNSSSFEHWEAMLSGGGNDPRGAWAKKPRDHSFIRGCGRGLRAPVRWT